VSSPDANIADTNPANDTITYGVTATVGGDSADVRALKSVSVSPIPAGDVQTFTLEIVNDGPQASQNVQVIDNFTSLINNSVGATGAGYIGGRHRRGLYRRKRERWRGLGHKLLDSLFGRYFAPAQL